MSPITPEDSSQLSKRIVAHHSFPGASHAAVERVLAKGEARSLPHGADLCVEGEQGDEIFFLVRGNITVLRRDISGENRVLSDMTCPCVFGHMSVVDGSRRSATCRANGPVELVVLHRQAVELLVSEVSVAGTALRRLLIASLCDQLSSANGFVRRIVQDHCDDDQPREHPSAQSGTAQTKAQSSPSNDESDLRELSLKLGGWEASLGDLMEMEKDVEYFMDEDQKRTRDSQKKR